MIRKDDVYRIGHLGKPHGIKGEITFRFEDDVFDRTDSDHLILEVDGILVPFFMEEYRFRSEESALVKFCDIDTQDKAARLTGCDVFFPRSAADADSDNMSWAEIKGYMLTDANGGREIGRIAAVDDSTVNILFELEDGKLIPASEELIAGVDKQRREISIEVPEGLLEL